VSESAISTRLEDWRYADADYLASADPVELAHWREVTVEPGQTMPSFVTRLPDASSAGQVDRLRVHVGQGGRYEHFEVLAAGGYARSEIEVTLDEGAHFEFGGVTIGGGSKRQEFVTRTIHAAPNATSNQVVRAVHWGEATGNFLGRIEVERDAQKTDAAQNFRALLLEKGASANTKPELEIFADDVQCAHGAAIGQMDEMAKFYMASRGLAPEIARRLLIEAFVADAFVAVSDLALQADLLDKALAQLEEFA